MRPRTLMTLATLAALALRAIPAAAGCGCNKPPPPAASIRPGFASPGDAVTLFADGIRAGGMYTALFIGAKGAAVVSGTAVLKRDLADGVVKPQLVVSAPAIRPGPAAVKVFVNKQSLTDVIVNGGTKVLEVGSDQFTMLQAPVQLAEGDGETMVQCYRGAVGANNTVYIPVDISNIAQHMVFSGLAMNYPLTFNAQDIAIYNTQGFLMQLLGPDQAGIYAIDDPAGVPNSLRLTYDRHEFVTYFDQHEHIGGLGLDPADPAWHSDGTRHVDHGHLVIAIHGLVASQNRPTPGLTPPFDLRITTALADGTTGVLANRTIQWSSACTAGTADN